MSVINILGVPNINVVRESISHYSLFCTTTASAKGISGDDAGEFVVGEAEEAEEVSVVQRGGLEGDATAGRAAHLARELTSDAFTQLDDLSRE